MQQSEFSEFVDIIQLVSEQYSKKPSDGLIALYWQSLKAYDLPAVREAFGKHLANTDNGQFMPKIADIIRMMTGSSQDSALSAWSKVDKAVRQVGPYETVVFDDPLIHRVLHDMGGWLWLCDKTDEAWTFVAKEFETRYRGFKSRNEQVDYPARLPGIFESHNAKEGHRVAPPMLIGDASKAQQVLELGVAAGSMLKLTRMGSIEAEDVPQVLELKIVGKE